MSETSSRMQSLYFARIKLEPAISLIFFITAINITLSTIRFIPLQEETQKGIIQNIFTSVIGNESAILLSIHYAAGALLLYITCIILVYWNAICLRYQDIPYGNSHCKKYPKRHLFLWTKIEEDFGDDGDKFITFTDRLNGVSIYCQRLSHSDKKSASRFANQ